VTNFRTYRNTDSPALAALWNRGLPDSSATCPLSVHEFDAHVVGGPHFDPAGLILAERAGKLVGYVHAGFGPDGAHTRPLHLSRALGTVAMLLVDPSATDPALESDLLTAAEQYLRGRGAQVLYAGGQYPLNPYYWGVYGGSEFAGILSAHQTFHRAVAAAGFAPVSTTVLLEADLTGPEHPDPRGVLMRRQTRLDVVEEPMPRTWWDALAIGEFRPTDYTLVSKSDQTELARATTWDMAWFCRRDGLARIGLIDMEVGSGLRRKGFGRHLVKEIFRIARAEGATAVALQTSSTNTAALALYKSVGFRPVETATLYRKPGGASAGSQ
jgi:ribosomal protein S18 acetylase RimI-like enzyme